MHIRGYGAWILAALAAPALAQPVAPAAESGNILTEIIITGSRQRAESVQSAPVAVSVVTAEAINNLHGSNILSLPSLVPNLTVSDVGVSVGVPVISLRGFTTRSSDIATEPGVAVYIDGVYQSVLVGALADLYDLDSLEVLRGPQGTLLGKNAPAGAILLNRSRPTGELGARARVEYGSHDLVQGQALINVPIVSDILAGKIYGMYRRRDAWVENLTPGYPDQGGEKRGTVRGALLFTPSADFSLYVTGDYSWDRSQQNPPRNVSDETMASCALFNLCDLHEGQRGVTGATFLARPKQDDYNATMVADLSVGDAVALKSTTGYRKYSQTNNTDLDGTALDIIHVFDQQARVRQFSQELRLNSLEGGGLDLGGRLDWVLGAYYSRSNARQHQGTYGYMGALSSIQSQKVKREGYALFGHAQFRIIEPWSVSAGIRRSRDKTRHNFSDTLPSAYPIPAAIPDPVHFERGTWNNTSVEAGTEFRFSPDQMVFFRYSEGYRGGGFIGLPPTPDAAMAFAPELSRSYELGAKADFFDHLLRVNLTLFDMKFNNLQRDVNLESEVGFTQAVANARAKSRGVEVETIVVPMDGLVLRGNFGYLDTKYTEFLAPIGNGRFIDITGQPIPYASKYTWSIGGDYTLPLSGAGPLESAVFHVNLDSRSSMTMSNTGHPRGHQPGYENLNASITLNTHDERFALTFYANNLFDKRWFTTSETLPGIQLFRNDNMGRLLGVSLEAKF